MRAPTLGELPSFFYTKLPECQASEARKNAETPFTLSAVRNGTCAKFAHIGNEDYNVMKYFIYLLHKM